MAFTDQQHIKIAVDNCIFTVQNGVLHILLIKMKRKPFAGSWALPGGLVKNSEPLDAAAKRVLHSETNVHDVFLEQLYTFSDPKRDPRDRAISTAYVALVPASNLRLKTNTKYAGVEWRPVAKIGKLAFDHNRIVEYAVQRLRWKLEYTNVVWSLLPEQFTLTDLQQIYEAVLGAPLDKRNFRKKILALKLIENTGKQIVQGAHRPAQLFRFVSRKPQIISLL